MDRLPREYSLAHLTVLGCSPPQAVEIAARCGYDFIGLRTIPLGLPGEPQYALDADGALLAATAKALKDTGVRLLDIEVAVLGEDRDVRGYERAIEVAGGLGAQHVLCNGWSGDRRLLQDQFDALCDLASPYGVTVNCEFVTFTQIPNLRDAREIVEASGRANAGVVIDTLHFGRSKTRLEELDSVHADRVHYLQLCDGAFVDRPTVEQLKHTARAERLYPGEGPSPIREIVERFPGRPLALEIIHDERIRQLGYEQFAKTCLERTRRYLEDT